MAVGGTISGTLLKTGGVAVGGVISGTLLKAGGVAVGGITSLSALVWIGTLGGPETCTGGDVMVDGAMKTPPLMYCGGAWLVECLSGTTWCAGSRFLDALGGDLKTTF